MFPSDMNSSPTMKENQSFSESTELRRELGLPEVLSIVINRIIGSGIFRTPGPMMAVVGSVTLFYGSWILGGIITIFSAILYAELVAMMPRSGGPYTYLKEAYNPLWAFLRGWAMFFVSETASIAAVALVFAGYGSSLIGMSIGITPSPLVESIAAILLVWLLTVTNLFGVGISGRFQDFLTVAKVGALFAVIVASFSSGGRFENFFDSGTAEPKTFLEGIIAIFAALRYGFFAYSGWEGATYVAEEVREPRKNLPRSLFLGIGIVMVLYLFANSAYLYQLSVEEMTTAGKQIARIAMEKAMGISGAILLSLAVVFSTFGNVSTQIMVKARTWHAMARDGLFFKSISTIHPVYRTPNRALLLQAFYATLLLIAASSAERAYESIIDFFSFTSAIFNLSTFLAVPLLRKKYPDVTRPYKAKLYPFSLWLVVGLYGIFTLVTLYDAFLPSLAGVALTLTGLPYYYFVARKRNGNTAESN